MANSESASSVKRVPGRPNFVFHASFEEPGADKLYSAKLDESQAEYQERYMPDEITRDYARRMHYAAYRMNKATRASDIRLWQDRYHSLRDRIVLGNRKLVYRAVRRRLAVANRADDMIGECHIVLIQAVAAFNPWLGIRFSTYAYTCLVRALSRLSQRMSSDWLARSVPLESLPDGEPREAWTEEPASTGFPRLEEFLRADHPLLSHREKTILSRRFCLQETSDSSTLEKVGRDLGLSKERVRQVQAAALVKLRRALLESGQTSGS